MTNFQTLIVTDGIKTVFHEMDWLSERLNVLIGNFVVSFIPLFMIIITTAFTTNEILNEVAVYCALQLIALSVFYAFVPAVLQKCGGAEIYIIKIFSMCK